MIVAAFTMVIGVFMSATTGYALSRFNFPGRRQLMLMFLVTQMFPVAILIVPIYVIMASLGLINTLASLVIAYLTVAVPFCAWMLKGYFDSISTSLDEAAPMDGCGPFATFWRVILPLARPGLAVTAFFTFLTAWGEVAYASAFIQTDSKFTLAYGLQQFVPAVQPAVGVPHRVGRAHHHPGRAGLLLRPAPPRLRPHRRRHEGLASRQPGEPVAPEAAGRSALTRPVAGATLDT